MRDTLGIVLLALWINACLVGLVLGFIWWPAWIIALIALGSLIWRYMWLTIRLKRLAPGKPHEEGNA